MIRVTAATVTVARHITHGLDRPHYGYEISKATGVDHQTVGPILRRMERDGWLESRWEDIDPTVEKRPRRRLFTTTPAGAVELQRLMTRAHRRGM